MKTLIAYEITQFDMLKATFFNQESSLSEDRGLWVCVYMLCFAIESPCWLSKNNLMKFSKERREYENIIQLSSTSHEREHGIREGMKQDGTFYYVTLEKQYKIMRLYNKC